MERYSLATTSARRSRASFPEDPDLRIQFLDVEIVEDVDAEDREIVRLRCRYVVRAELESVLLSVEVRNAIDVSVFYSNDDLLKDRRKRKPGVHTVELGIPKHLLAPGAYNVAFGFWEPGRAPEHFPTERLTFQREEPLNRLSAHGISWPGLLYVPGTWRYVEGDR